MKKPLTVFLCSTVADLADERECVLDALRRLQLQQDSMEFFGARADLPIETCLAEVRRSDVLVVAVGHRYGTIVPELGVSFSEAEYQEGHRLGKPCLVYLRDEGVPVLAKHVERDPEKVRLLERWKRILATRHTIARFANAHALAVQVTADLARTVQALEEAARSAVHTTGDSTQSDLAELQSIVSTAIEAGVPHDLAVAAVRRAMRGLVKTSRERAPTAFLSYARPDEPLVKEVADGLRAHGIDVWIDNSGNQLGDSLVTHVERGLDAADFVAFFLSKASVKSEWARKELNVAISRQVTGSRGATVLPILLEDVEVPALLRDVVYLDLRGGDVKGALKRLVASIRRYHRERLDDVLRQARELSPLKRQLLLSLRKYDKGKRIEPGGDRDSQQLAGYSILAVEGLADNRGADGDATIVTLTDRGWKVAAAVDSLGNEG
jgi:hypothetical protein